MICFIPTKGRLNTKTYKLFEQVGIKVKHFIEPQEIELYNVPNKVNIQKNNGGISYVRNFMLNYAKENEFWEQAAIIRDVTEEINKEAGTVSDNTK